MTDHSELIERLRADSFTTDILREAADALTALEAKVVEFAENSDKVVAVAADAVNRANALEAENKRLREGLEAVEKIAASAHRHRGNIGKEAAFLSAIENRTRSLLTKDKPEAADNG